MTQSTSMATLPISCIVAIGVSAGGVSALNEFFSKIDSKRMAFVIVQHLEPGGVTLAMDVLKSYCRLPVALIEEGMDVQAGVIYFAPPHSSVAIENAIFSVQPTEGLDQRRSTIDHFMSSIAEDLKQKCIGIILSGEGSDGTEGLRAIGDAGGMTVAQDPQTAEHPNMPESAIRFATVDHILPIESMAEEIANYEKYIMRLLDKTLISKLRDEITAALVSICDFLYRSTGHDFKHYKTNTLVRRIQRRMQILQIVEVGDYVERLQTQADEGDALFKELLINVTAFFRDPLAFDELRTLVLEKSLAKHPVHQKYRIWIAGCSTGEEAYTLAIIAREILSELKHPPEVQIIATDIDEVALNAARRGSYAATIADDVSADRLKRFFVRKGGRYVVTKELRDMCLFSSHNIINDPPFSQIDLLTCRNVLIYLGPHLQQKLIPVFHYALKPQGYLFLGTSESLTGHQELFRTVSARYRIAQRRTTAIRSAMTFPTPGASQQQRPLEPLSPAEVDLNLIGQRIILDEFSPRYAIVNEEGQIVAVSSGVHRYLEPSEGLFHNNVLKLVNPALRTALRSVLSSAKKQKRKYTNEHSLMEFEGALQRIGVTAQPMPQLGEHLQLFMLVFQYLGQFAKTDVAQGAGQAGLNSIAAVEQLERELTVMREDLDKTVQDLEASNEELKSSNEELLSMNEELQSANEELETSKEDVQAANDALLQSNNDLENLLAGTNIATLFLDEKNRIKSFTPAIARFYPIIAADIGRNIADFTSRATSMPPFPLRPNLTNSNLGEAEILMPDGQIFLRRIIPYRTHEGQFDGLVVTFIDISELRRSEGRFQTLANLVPSITWMASENGDIFYLNSRWFEYTGATQVESYYKKWFDFVHPDDVDEMRKTWGSLAESDTDLHAEFRLRRADNTYRWFVASGVATRDSSGEIIQWFGICNDIEEQKAEVDLLKESGEGLRTIVETIPQYIWRTDADGSADYCSESFVSFLASRRESVLGWGWTEFIHHDDRAHVQEVWADARQRQDKVTVTFRIVVKKELIWVRSEGNPFFNMQGQLVKYYGTWTNITLEVMAEEARKEALDLYQLENSKFEALFADAPSAMALFKGSDLIVEKANIRFQALLGPRLKVGEPYFGPFQERAQTPHARMMLNVFTSGQPYFEKEAAFTLPEDSKFAEQQCFLDIAYQRVNDPDGLAYGLFVHANDVTDQVRARLSVLESEQRFRLLADAMPQIVFTADVDGNINYFNSRWEEFTGFTFEQTKNWGWGPVLHPDDLQRTIDSWTNSVKNSIPYEIEYRLKGKDGQFRWHLGRAFQIPESVDSDTRWFGTNTDIHEVKMLTQQLETARLHAESANQIKSRFLANMSHEIRTPLGVIIGFTDLLKEQIQGQVEVESYVDRIVTNSRQLGTLIDEILDLSKVEADRLEADISVFNLRNQLSEVFSSMGMLARDKGLRFEEKWVCADPGLITSDPARFRQILINVIGNAIKFTDHGSIKITMDIEGDEDDRVLLTRVRDTGIGLNEEQKARIFEPFIQADSSVTRRFGGTGLGLTLSQKLARVLGGDLRIEESAVGAGSTFTISIKIGPPIAARSQKAKLTTRNDYLQLSPEVRVLIVDDSPDNRAIVARFLKLAGAQFDVAENGAIAVEKALSHHYDVILMDIQMPVMDGYEALIQLRKKGYEKPIMALTAHAMKEEKDRCLEAGFNEYLSKPVDRQSLLRLIKDLTHS
ncbi:MAG: PAS domain S-box protein [Proteobacteria bacterium]|nr:MAG: PAS domain S-box protein [Pseudomonadota bacterium]